MYLAQGHNTATRVRIETRPLTLDFDAPLRERLRTHKVFTIDQCFYLNDR